MTTVQRIPSRTFTLEDIERIIYKNSDALAVGIARSCERLEERMEVMQLRLLERLNELSEGK